MERATTQPDLLTLAGHQVIMHPLRGYPSGHHPLVHVVPHGTGAPFAEPLTYTLPEAMHAEVVFGSLVLVPLGSREQVGVVVGFPEEAPADLALKPIRAVLDPEPVFDEHLYRVATWIADRCHCPLDEALQPIMPEAHLIGASRVIRLTPTWPQDEVAFARCSGATRSAATRLRHLLVESGGEIELSVLKRRLPMPGLASLIQQARRHGWILEEYRLSRPRVRARVVPTWSMASPDGEPGRLGERQRRVLDYFQARHTQELPQAELCRELRVTPHVLRSLETRGLLRCGTIQVNRASRSAAARTTAPPLTPDQAAAAAVLEKAVAGRSEESFLLYGVTGSGKTEVYLHAMEEALESGRQALFLVPEISLTAQVAAIFRARFGERVAILHSRLSDGERFDEWSRVRRGEADVIVGARSALFAPAPDPGVIVLDEEHDHSYKQDSSPRYLTRSVAEQRAARSGCPLILGSATPSVETFYRAEQGALHRLDLPYRILDRPLPEVRVVDLRPEFRKSGAGVFSSELREAIAARLARGEQVILFVNRRGFSAFILCRDCGYVPHCPRCNVSLTFHADHTGRLVCHHCGHERRAPSLCPKCSGTRIRHFGIGTQKVEEAARELFPEARLARLDRDTTTAKEAHTRIVARFRERDADILIGTQMVAKGFDFPHVTLVGIITADTALNLPDFRAAERTFQLLTQVAGRAGRGPTPGEVILQTFTPDHYAVRAASAHDYLQFYTEEISSREELLYPPFSSLARFVVADSHEESARGKIYQVSDLLAAPARAAGVELLGPTTAPLARLKGKYRWHLLLKSPDDAALNALLDDVLPHLRRSLAGWVLDVDPVSLM